MIKHIELKAISNIKAHNGSWLLKPATVVLCLTLAMAAIAGAEGEQAGYGQAEITRPDSHTTIVKQIKSEENRASINWEKFDVGADETVNFIQPNANSIILNRVIGKGASEIYGTINANGHVLILNADGVHFNSGSSVNVAGILASTYNISTDNFEDGNYQFEEFTGEHSGRIYNRGKIEVSGLAAMLSHDVEIAGIIHAEVATVMLGSNPTWVLDAYGDDTINFAVSDELLQRKATVSNSGEIYADGGRVFLTVDQAESVVVDVINVSENIHADTADIQDGVIVLSGRANSLVADSGELTAKGEAGRREHMAGDLGRVFDEGPIDASGHRAGGEILVGGGVIETSGKEILSPTSFANAPSANGKGATPVPDSDDLKIGDAILLSDKKSNEVSPGSSVSSTDPGDVAETLSISESGESFITMKTSDGAPKLVDVVNQTGSGGEVKGNNQLYSTSHAESPLKLTLLGGNKGLIVVAGSNRSGVLSGSPSSPLAEIPANFRKDVFAAQTGFPAQFMRHNMFYQFALAGQAGKGIDLSGIQRMLDEMFKMEIEEAQFDTSTQSFYPNAERRIYESDADYNTKVDLINSLAKRFGPDASTGKKKSFNSLWDSLWDRHTAPGRFMVGQDDKGEI